MTRVLLTTSIPYVNGDPHIGHAFEYTQADVLTRLLRRAGHEVFFTAGTDENALKNVESAEKAKRNVQEFVDEKVANFQRLLTVYDVKPDVFIRTSSPEHALGCQELWRRCKKDIYKKTYTGLYCVGCETFYEDGEFLDNICPNHKRTLERVEEENYFFALSRYQAQLEELISSGTLKIFPTYRKDELLNFVKKGLQDFSISRPSTRTKGWGVKVPGDDTQTMYVWYDALTNYITALGFGTSDESRYTSHWEKADARIHIVGKDIIKFHGIYWPAMLLSAGLPVPTHLFTHGFITVNGQKMSKSLGNTVDPFELVTKYGLSAIRYYLAREIPVHDDGDYSDTRMSQLYTADLANELGNLVSRTCAIAAKDGIEVDSAGTSIDFYSPQCDKNELNELELLLQYQDPLVSLWREFKKTNKSFNEFEPWSKSHQERDSFLKKTLVLLNSSSLTLKAYLPEIGAKIQKATSGKIEKITPLFPRLIT